MKSFALGAALVLAAVAPGRPAPADDKKGPAGDKPAENPAVVKGTVLEVIGDHLVIEAEKPNRKLKLNPAKGLTVTVGGRAADLGQLRPGMAVEVVRDKEGKAVSVKATAAAAEGGRREVKGTIRRATPDGDGTRLMVESDAGEVYTHHIPSGATVTVGGESAKADQLAPGMAATLSLDDKGGVSKVAARKADGKKEAPKGEIPGLTPGRSSERLDVAAGGLAPYAGTYEGTLAYNPVLGYDFGQQSDDGDYLRPLYRHPLHPWTLNVLPRKKAFQRAAQEPGQPDLYFEAFLHNGGTGDPYPNGTLRVPGYDEWYWSNPGSRYIPLANRYRYDFRFGLGQQEPPAPDRR